MPLTHVRPPEAELRVTGKPQRGRPKAVAAIVLALVIVITAGFTIWYVPVREIDRMDGADTARSRQQLINDTRTTLAQIVGGMFVLMTGLLGAYFTLRQLATAQSGQITDRFSRAVDHLASTTLSTKLGGLYALERIAKDSQSDHWTVMQLLTTYVRSVAGSRASDDVPEELPVALEIRWSQTESARLDLRGADLSHVDLRGLNFARSDFRSAKLNKAMLSGVILDGADLTYADLSGAELDWANLRGSILLGANVTSTFFWHADLRQTEMLFGKCDRVNLRFADLTDANVENVGLSDCTLEGAILTRTNLRNANLCNAILTRAHLIRTNMDNTLLAGADLRNAAVNDVSFATTRGLTSGQIYSMRRGLGVTFPTHTDA